VQWHKEREVAIEKAVKMLEPDLVIKQMSAISDSITPFAMAIDPSAYEDSFRVMRDQLFELLKIDNITKEQIHVVDGAAEYAIPKFINVSQTGLLILGTVGRTGFSGLFIGNTAEKILAEVNCEILALKY
jgi:nucleotide-binding universal stress UspA family protein